MGVFEKIKGALVGHVDGLLGNAGATQMEGVLRRVTADCGFPILKVDDFGHNCPNTILPIGARVRPDADRQTIEEVEPFLT